MVQLILAAYDTTGNNLAGTWVTLADIGDIRDNTVIQSGDSSGFPVCSGNV